MYQNDPVKVLTGEVRLSYLTVITPRAANPGEDPKYSVRLMIPKSDMATKADIDASIQAAVQAALNNPKVWGGVMPPKMEMPVHDGDGEKPKGGPYEEECRGHWIINASTKGKPGVVDTAGNELLPNDIYSGMRGRVTIRFFGYSSRGNKGIGCGLGNIMKTRDDEALSGRSSAASDFAGIFQQAPAGAAMPATPGYSVPGYTPPPAFQPQQPYQPPMQPGFPQQQHQVNINPLTGLPM